MLAFGPNNTRAASRRSKVRVIAGGGQRLRVHVFTGSRGFIGFTEVYRFTGRFWSMVTDLNCDVRDG